MEFLNDLPTSLIYIYIIFQFTETKSNYKLILDLSGQIICVYIGLGSWWMWKLWGNWGRRSKIYINEYKYVER